MRPTADAALPRDRQWPVFVAVAAGGVAGAEARYGVQLLAPHRSGSVPWGTLGINIGGCLLMGLLVGTLAALRRPPRLARPLLGTGFLGGFTTFSAYSVDVVALLRAGRPGVAIGYLIATVALCLPAVVVGRAAARALLADRARQP